MMSTSGVPARCAEGSPKILSEFRRLSLHGRSGTFRTQAAKPHFPACLFQLKFSQSILIVVISGGDSKKVLALATA